MKKRISQRKRSPVIPAAALACVLMLAAGADVVRAQGHEGSPISVETNSQLFATMCALDAAGFDANANTLEIYPASAALRARLLQLKGPATEAVREFYKQHQFVNADETLSPFLTFSLVVRPPPKFDYIVSHAEMPPAVLTIEGFNDILSNFYAEAHLERDWATVEPEVDHEVERVTSPVRQIVYETTGYLREILQPSGSRTFTVLVEPLVGNRVNFRNVGDHYAIIVGPGPTLPLGDIRHAFLHFLLDPLVLKFQQTISTRRELLNIAAKAPQLPPTYENDFVGLFDECLVRAVELRMRKLPVDQLEAAFSANDRTGFILVRPLYQQVVLFEQSEPAMSYYFPKLAEGINTSNEIRRFEDFKFAGPSEPVTSGGIHGEDATAGAEAELNQSLVRGDRQIAMQDAAGAAATFQGILAQHPNLPRAVYGLALASVLQQQADKAETLFEQLVSRPPTTAKAATVPSPDILAWSHVYLGRIHDLRGGRDEAMIEYRAALSVSGAPESARLAAQQGLEAPYHPEIKGQSN
jgi:tetratricopeptide (TPR) repeat protein